VWVTAVVVQSPAFDQHRSDLLFEESEPLFVRDGIGGRGESRPSSVASIPIETNRRVMSASFQLIRSTFTAPWHVQRCAGPERYFVNSGNSQRQLCHGELG